MWWSAETQKSLVCFPKWGSDLMGLCGLGQGGAGMERPKRVRWWRTSNARPRVYDSGTGTGERREGGMWAGPCFQKLTLPCLGAPHPCPFPLPRPPLHQGGLCFLGALASSVGWICSNAEQFPAISETPIIKLEGQNCRRSLGEEAWPLYRGCCIIILSHVTVIFQGLGQMAPLPRNYNVTIIFSGETFFTFLMLI